MGPSGSGKSTLLNIIGGLDHVSSGEVILDGDRIDSLDENALVDIRRGKIAYVFQQYHLIPSLTALENVLLPLTFCGENNKHEKALGILKRVGLEKRAEHKPSQLSGGEQQRVAIARAYATDPDLRVDPNERLRFSADSPLVGIDAATFCSNAIYPIELMPGWLKAIASVNPLTYVVDAIRSLLVTNDFSRSSPVHAGSASVAVTYTGGWSGPRSSPGATSRRSTTPLPSLSPVSGMPSPSLSGHPADCGGPGIEGQASIASGIPSLSVSAFACSSSIPLANMAGISSAGLPENSLLESYAQKAKVLSAAA
jgi:hypothetical protein